MERIRKTIVAVITTTVGFVLPSAFALDEDGGSTIHANCREAGFSESVCTCIVREASSRFTEDQMRVLASAIPDLSRITEDPDIGDRGGATVRLSAVQLAYLRQRAEGADIVIQRACGIGLSLDAGR